VQAWVPVGGGVPAAFARTAADQLPRHIKISERSVVWTTAKDGARAGVLADGRSISGSFAGGLAFDGRHAYAFDGPRLVKIDVANGDAPTTLAVVDSPSGDIRIDRDCVYYADASRQAVMMVHR
jgi:hypothetical protein